MIAAAVAAASLALMVWFAARGSADPVVTFTVTSLEDSDLVNGCEPSEGCTLREAIVSIDEEEETGAKYKIVFAVEGTIHLQGELRLQPAHEVEVEIVGPGTSNLILDQHEEERVFTAKEVETLKMSGLTLTGGEEEGIDGGGGLLARESEVTLSHVRVTGNSAVEGGGIAVEDESNLALIDSEVDHNVATEDIGGGISDTHGSGLQIEGSTIAENEAAEDAGGGIGHEGEVLRLTDSTVRDNHADEGGGGIWFFGGFPHAEITGSTIEGNSSGGGGGGIKAMNAELGVAISTIAHNTAAIAGGAIYADSAVAVEDSTLVGNEAPLAGGIVGESSEGLVVTTSTLTANTNGAVVAPSGSTAITGSTVVGNAAAAGAPSGGVSGAQLTVTSTILDENTLAGAPSDCGGPVVSEGHNLLGSELGCSWAAGSGDRIGVDPLLAPLGNYGGPTATMPPASRESPAINHGSNPAATDQRHRTRPVPTGVGNTDIGAVEVQAPVLTTEVTVAPDHELTVGETLTCSPGQWNTDTIADPVHTYTWIADPGGSAETIGTGEHLELEAADAGRPIVCEVAVDDGATSVSARSQSIELVPASAAFSPTSIDFGEQRLAAGPSAARGITITASGGVPLTVTSVESTDAAVFAVDSSPCTAAPISRGVCVLEVTFDPSARGVAEATIVIHTDGGDRSVPVQGTGVEPIFIPSADPLTFPATEVGDPSAAQELVVTNTGNDPLRIQVPVLEGADPADFALTGDSCEGAELPEGGHCSVEVTFTPRASGQRAATIHFPGNDPSSVALAGTAIAAGLLASPAGLEFGSRQLGSGAGGPLSLTLSNPGSAPTTLQSIAIEGPDAGAFAFTADGCLAGSLAPGAECVLEVSYEPTAVGSQSAVLQVGGEIPLAVPLAGVGAAPPGPAQSSPAPQASPSTGGAETGSEPASAPRLVRPGKGPLVLSDNAVRPRLSCAHSAVACEARLTLLRGSGPPRGTPRRLGGRTVRFAPGESRPVAISLTAAARRVLAEAGRLNSVLEVDGPGPATRTQVTLAAGRGTR